MVYSAQIFVVLAVIASLAFCTPIDVINAPIPADHQQHQQQQDGPLVSIETVKLESLPQRQGRQYFGGYPGYGGGYSGSSAYASANSGAGGYGMYPGFGGGYSGSSAMASANSGAGGYYGKK